MRLFLSCSSIYEACRKLRSNRKFGFIQRSLHARGVPAQYRISDRSFEILDPCRLARHNIDNPVCLKQCGVQVSGHGSGRKGCAAGEIYVRHRWAIFIGFTYWRLPYVRLPWSRIRRQWAAGRPPGRPPTSNRVYPRKADAGSGPRTVISLEGKLSTGAGRSRVP
jgi:hypothetical protein